MALQTSNILVPNFLASSVPVAVFIGPMSMSSLAFLGGLDYGLHYVLRVRLTPDGLETLRHIAMGRLLATNWNELAGTYV